MCILTPDGQPMYVLYTCTCALAYIFLLYDHRSLEYDEINLICRQSCDCRIIRGCKGHMTENR